MEAARIKEFAAESDRQLSILMKVLPRREHL
jgi:hypothetical protein